MSQKKTSRRVFLFAAGLGAGSTLIAKRSRAQTPSNQPRVAFVGCGGIVAPGLIRIVSDLGAVCPCYADVDAGKIASAKSVWPNATHYSDYRQMFDKQAKDFDAVIVCTPDHHHYPVTAIAMQLGKHVYTQKPLTHTIWEARQLTLAAAKYKVATQMGNQCHSSEDNLLTVAYIRSGMLGEVREAHAWTNRPVWPQGGTMRSDGERIMKDVTGHLVWPEAVTRPLGEDTIPETVNWDCWLGPAPVRPYKKDVYHPMLWRGWWDFGTGSLGDETPHLIDAIFWGMDAKAPSAVEPVTLMSQPLDSETFPGASVMKWEFAANGSRPGFALYWYERGLKPAIPADLEPGRMLPECGTLIIGSKATLMTLGDAAYDPRIIPSVKHDEMGKPPRVIERSTGHVTEWFAACKGEKPLDFPKCSFAYSGALTETILLGNVAARMQRRIEWDSANLKVTKPSAANQYVSKEYREGWKFSI